MMNKTLITTFILFTYLSLQSMQAQISKVETNLKRVNFGIKGGFNSVLYFANKVEIGDETFNKMQTNYKVSEFVSAFMRINLKKDFLQPEIAYHVSRGDILFNKNQNSTTTTTQDIAVLSSKITSIEMPLLYGHYIVKKSNYGMTMFFGPKIKYIWKSKSNTSFNNFGYDNIKEDLYQYSVNAVLGLGVNISNLFFDFRYEQGLNNISKTISAVDKETGNPAYIKVNRTASQLNFSLGFIF